MASYLSINPDLIQEDLHDRNAIIPEIRITPARIIRQDELKYVYFVLVQPFRRELVSTISPPLRMRLTDA
jgi:hypothetical protein